MVRRPVSHPNSVSRAPSRQRSPRSTPSPVHQTSNESSNRLTSYSGTDSHLGPNEFALLKDAVGQLQHRIESLEEHVREQETVYSKKFEQIEVQILTGTSENPEALSPPDLLVNLYHNNSNQFRSNLRSAIRDYMFSSIGSMFPDDNHTELASETIFLLYCLWVSLVVATYASARRMQPNLGLGDWTSMISEANKLSGVIRSVFDDIRRKYFANVKYEFMVSSKYWFDA